VPIKSLFGSPHSLGGEVPASKKTVHGKGPYSFGLDRNWDADFASIFTKLLEGERNCNRGGGGCRKFQRPSWAPRAPSNRGDRKCPVWGGRRSGTIIRRTYRAKHVVATADKGKTLGGEQKTRPKMSFPISGEHDSPGGVRSGRKKMGS